MVSRGAFEYEGEQDGLGGHLASGVLGSRGGDGAAERFCPLGPSDLACLHRACLPHLMASYIFDDCVLDMCNFQGLQQMLCAHMAALTETCQDAGYVVKPWRGPQFCRELGQGSFLQMQTGAEGQHLKVLAQVWGLLAEPLCLHTGTGKSAVGSIH